MTSFKYSAAFAVDCSVACDVACTFAFANDLSFGFVVVIIVAISFSSAASNLF